MGIFYLKDKPEADSFSYAYVETAEGSFIRVSKENMKKALGLIAPIDTEITLLASNWALCDTGAYYTQLVTLEEGITITANSKVELRPTPDQVVQLMHDELALFISNDNGVVTAYCVNGTPSENLTYEVRIKEEV